MSVASCSAEPVMTSRREGAHYTKDLSEFSLPDAPGAGVQHHTSGRRRSSHPPVATSLEEFTVCGDIKVAWRIEINAEPAAIVAS